MEPRSESRRRALLHWSAAVLIVLGYAVYYGQMVVRHTAVPYFDQTNYLYRIYHIHDVWKSAKGVAQSKLPPAYVRPEMGMPCTNVPSTTPCAKVATTDPR